MKRQVIGGFFACAAFGLGPAIAAETQTLVLGNQQVMIHQAEFLTQEEQATLALVGSNEDALRLFVTTPGRFAALAVSPAEGFIRGGQPVASAIALSDLPSRAAAQSAALEACNAARKSGPDCVVVLEVAPN